MNFVVSMRLGDPPTTEPVRGWLEHYPGLRFKLDPRSNWTEELVAELVELGCVDSSTSRASTRARWSTSRPIRALYRLVVEGFPEALIEDPAMTDETRPILEPHAERVTWDAIIHSVADIKALPWPPRSINIKPSRFGSWQRLCDTYDYCEEKGITAYGGGQFELGPGRGHIQYLASLFHPESSNDVAPSWLQLEPPRPGLPTSPLEPTPEPTGFRWGGATIEGDV